MKVQIVPPVKPFTFNPLPAKVRQRKPKFPKVVYGGMSTGDGGKEFFTADPDPESMLAVGETITVGEYRLVRTVEVSRRTVCRIKRTRAK